MIEFERVKSVDATPRYADIWEAYDKPSKTKIALWREWKRELESIGATNVAIGSRNIYQFSIVFTLNGQRGKITKDHNYLEAER